MSATTNDSEKITIHLRVEDSGRTVNANVPANMVISQLLPALLHKLALNESRYVLEHEASGEFLSETATLNSAGVRNGDFLRLTPIVVVRIPVGDPTQKIQVRITDQAGGKNINARLPADAPIAQLVAALIVKLQLPSNTAYYMSHKESGKRLVDAETLYSAEVCHGDTLRLMPDVTAGGIAIRSYRDLQFIDMYLNRKQLETNNNSYKLFALFLYTKADSNLSQFFRNQFEELLYMSDGSGFQFYIVEQPDKRWLPLMREELSEKLGPHIERVWRLLEANQFHPVDSASVYDIALQLGIARQQLPCAVFFTRLDSHQVLIVPFETLLGRPVAEVEDEALLHMFRKMHDEIFRVSILEPSDRLAELKEGVEQSAETWNWGDAFPQIVLETLTEAIKVTISSIISALLK